MSAVGWDGRAGVTDAITGRRSAEAGDLRRTHSMALLGASFAGQGL